MSNLDPLDIRAQETAETNRQERERQISRQEAEDFKWLMADKRGRRIVWGLLERTGLFRNPFTGSSETFFRCGEMNIGQRYMALINEHCAERYNTMVTEQQQNVRNADTGRRNKH